MLFQMAEFFMFASLMLVTMFVFGLMSLTYTYVNSPADDPEEEEKKLPPPVVFTGVDNDGFIKESGADGSFKQITAM